MIEITESQNYLQTLEFIKEQVKNSHMKARLSVNKEMLILYWKVGKTIIEKQEQEGWGTKITRKRWIPKSRQFFLIFCGV